MADQIAAESARPDEPQCYNCGGMGHWAVACPEPTRETPAGLAAWRNASATRQGSGRAQHNDGRRSKGPIITKYGPPPPPTGYGAHFPPPPGYPPPHSSYTAPPPQPPTHPHYPPQYHYLPGHGQPPLPPPPPPSHGHHYPPPAYHPPPESYHGQQPRSSYPGPSPTYGAPHTAPHTAPQNYGGYPYSTQDSPQFFPPRPAYSGSYTQGSGSGQKRHHQRPQPTHRNSAPSPPKSHTSQVASSPPKPPASSPPTHIAHALPPKPPKSVHDIDHGRDQRNNKRKHDHQTRPRDIKEHHPGRNHGSPKIPPVIHNNHHHQSNASAQHHQGPQNRLGKQGSNRRRSSAGNHGSNQPRMQRQQSKDSLTPQATGPQSSPQLNNEDRRPNNNGETHHEHHDQHKTADRPKEDSNPPKAAETSPILIQSVPSLPPKPSLVVEAYVPKAPDERATRHPLDSIRLSERNVSDVDGNKERDRDDRSSTARHGTKSESSAQEDAERDERPLKRFRRDSRDRSRSTSRHRDSDDLPPLNRRRSRSVQRRSSPSRSPRSRNSSVSSRSSDLNSLEAELLGVSARRPSTESEQRRRPERVAPPKAKRRKPTNSAFSRRW